VELLPWCILVLPASGHDVLERTFAYRVVLAVGSLLLMMTFFWVLRSSLRQRDPLRLDVALLAYLGGHHFRLVSWIAWQTVPGSLQHLSASIVFPTLIQSFELASDWTLVHIVDTLLRIVAAGTGDAEFGASRLRPWVWSCSLLATVRDWLIAQTAGKVPQTALCWTSQELLMGFSAPLHGLPRRAQNSGKRKVLGSRGVRGVRQPPETLPGRFGEAARALENGQFGTWCHNFY